MTTATLTANDRCFSDIHKDAYGFRPSAHQYALWAAMTDAELDIEEARLQKAVQFAIREEEEAEANAVRVFEAHIAKLRANYGLDRATAIRWDVEACGLTEDVRVYGMDAYRYEHGLPYGYFGRR